MDAFLLNGSTPSARIDPASGGTRATLLFNPQPRQRFVFPTHNDKHGGGERKKGPPLGGGEASGYKQFRSSKLSEQAPKEVSQLFAGMSFYFNGRSGDKQTMHLKGAVSKHGGRTTPFMSMKGVTHVIAENLSAVKTDKAMKSLKMKVVHPDWLIRCMAEGKLLPDAPFRVVRSQKLGMSNFFGSSSSSSSSTPASSSSCGQRSSTQKENKNEYTPRRRRSSSGHSATRLSINCEGKHVASGRGNRCRGRGVEGGDGGGVGVARPAHAAVVKSSNGHGDSRRRRRDVGSSTSEDISKSRGSSKKRVRTSSSRAGCDGIRSQGSTFLHDRGGWTERELGTQIRTEVQQ